MTNASSHSFDFGGEVVGFSIERTSRRKTVGISVGYDGVRVLAPDLDNEKIVGIVRSKGPWVLRKQAGYRELGRSPSVREFVSGETFHYLGRPYRLTVSRDGVARAEGVVARGSSLLASVPREAGVVAGRARVRAGLSHWYRHQALRVFPTRAAAMARLLGVATPTVLVVDQSKRWGSCDADGRVRLNWRLVMAHISQIDYVIAHEVCHILEPNHSRRFWRSLETILPDYETRLRDLEKSGHRYFW